MRDVLESFSSTRCGPRGHSPSRRRVCQTERASATIGAVRHFDLDSDEFRPGQHQPTVEPLDLGLRRANIAPSSSHSTGSALGVQDSSLHRMGTGISEAARGLSIDVVRVHRIIAKMPLFRGDRRVR